MNILKCNGRFLALIVGFFIFINTVFIVVGKASAIVDKRYSANSKCSHTVETFIPKWAPKDGWNIKCVKGTVDFTSVNDKNLMAITYPKLQFIFIRDDITDEHDLQNIIIHEWTHAAVAEYKMKRGANWQEWVKYVNSIHGHSSGYYGKPEEVLAENTARCTLGYYYNFLSMDKARCSVIHKLFPQLTTVQNKYDFNE